MAEARELMDNGAEERAAAVLGNLLKTYPDSVHAPEATYLLGRLALQEGNAERAAELLGRVVEDLPAAEVYDKACKSLADARALQGDLPGALEALDRMAFLDPSYPPRVIDLYRLQLRASPAQRP
jgi:tetratricopeptide (TPR) repeat protein